MCNFQLFSEIAYGAERLLLLLLLLFLCEYRTSKHNTIHFVDVLL